jgi:GxxExxY protein
MTPEDKLATKALKEEERAQVKALKEAEKAEKKALMEAKRAEKKAMKEAQPPKRRGRPPKVKPEGEVPADLPVYGRLEELKRMADEVYASLGAGHLESIYHAAMAVELRLAGLSYESEQVMPVTHKGHFVGIVRADIILAKECVLEFKISGKLDEAKQQARQYMKLQTIPFGFVVKFPKSDGGAIEFVDARLADD